MKNLLPVAPKRIAVSTLAWTLIIAFTVLSCGCEKREVSLEYGSSPENLVVELRTSGGLPNPSVDGISEFKLYGDGRVIERPGGDERKPMVEGRLTAGEVRAFLERIRDTGFFGLQGEYANRKVMDGVTKRITVNLKGEKKEVLVYMKDVKEFARATDVIMGYPLRDSSDYVPDKGYLLVQKTQVASTDQPAPQGVTALLPPTAVLLQAAETRKPIEIGGESLVGMMKYESTQKYRGLTVDVDGSNLTLYPLYEPVVR